LPAFEGLILPYPCCSSLSRHAAVSTQPDQQHKYATEPEKSAKIAMAAHRDNTPLREAALKLGHVTGEQFDHWVRAGEMTGPKP
jgi:hypothetical protein